MPPSDRGIRWAAASPAVAHTFVAALDDVVDIDGDDGHHLQRVRRLEPGETVTAADGAGAWREYAVTEARAGAVTLHATGAVHHEPGLTPGLTIAFALTKGEQPEVVVRALTELGADRVMPFVSARSQVRWRGDRAAKEHVRLCRVAREAAAQSRRATLPDIAPVGDVAGLAGRPGLVVAGRSGTAADRLAAPADGGWVVVVGPEGGLTPDEIAALGGEALVVGPHVLRAGTAAIAVAAALAGRRRPEAALSGLPKTLT